MEGGAAIACDAICGTIGGGAVPLDFIVDDGAHGSSVASGSSLKLKKVFAIFLISHIILFMK